MRGGNSVPLHEFLGEAFTGLELRGRFGWAEYRPAPASELINDPKLKRQFRADHGQVWLELTCNSHNRFQAFQIDGDTFGFVTDPAVPGSAVEFGDARRLPQLPGESVLASAVAYQENFHGQSK
jgi:hypothetical protein